MSREIKCPRCHETTLFAPENPHRPFCSERCKLIDLGQWAEEKYAIPISQAGLDSFDGGSESGSDADTKSDESEQPDT